MSACTTIPPTSTRFALPILLPYHAHAAQKRFLTPFLSEQKLCFVMGPIGEDGSDERKHADIFLNDVVKDVCEKDLGYIVRRSDEVAEPGMVTDAIIRDISEAPIAIADLTFLNANVFYEIEIRHTLRKPFIHFVQEGTRLPFNIHSYRAIIKDIHDWHGKQKAKEELHKHVVTIENPIYKVSNPVTQAQATYPLKTVFETHENRGLEEALRRFEEETGGRSLSANVKLLMKQYIETRVAALSALSDLKGANRAGEEIVPYRERWERLTRKIQCAPMARFTSGGRIHPDSCR